MEVVCQLPQSSSLLPFFNLSQDTSNTKLRNGLATSEEEKKLRSEIKQLLREASSLTQSRTTDAGEEISL